MKINEEKLTLKYRAKTFYFASLFLPTKIKNDIENLYIFCRLLDDLGDDQNLSKIESSKKLQKVKKQIKKKKIRFSSCSKIHRIND